MDLPKIEMIGLQTTQGFFKHEQGEAAVAPVGAGFGHEKNFVAAAFQACSHPDFGFAAAIFPTVVEKSDSAVDGLVNDLNGSFRVGSFSEVMTAEAENRNFGVGAAELAERDGSG
jgi:hypothetical protein